MNFNFLCFFSFMNFFFISCGPTVRRLAVIYLTPQPGPVGGVSSFDELANRFKEEFRRGEREYALARNLVASTSTLSLRFKERRKCLVRLMGYRIHRFLSIVRRSEEH